MDPDELQLLTETLLGLAAVGAKRAASPPRWMHSGGATCSPPNPRRRSPRCSTHKDGPGTWSAALHDVLAIDVETPRHGGPASASSCRGRAALVRAQLRGRKRHGRRESCSARATRPPCSWSRCTRSWRETSSSPSNPRTFRSSGDRVSIPASGPTPCPGPRARMTVLAEGERADGVVGDRTSSRPAGPVPADRGCTDRHD